MVIEGLDAREEINYKRMELIEETKVVPFQEEKPKENVLHE